MATFMTSSVVNLTPSLFLGESGAFMVDRMVYGVVMFSGFLILFLVKEQEVNRLNGLLKEEQRLREGIRIAENRIRNQIILINQAAYVLAEKQEYDDEMVSLIRENTIKMDRELVSLQNDGVDPRDSDDNALFLF